MAPVASLRGAKRRSNPRPVNLLMTWEVLIFSFLFFPYSKVASSATQATPPRNDDKCAALLSTLSPDSPTARYMRTLIHLADKKAFPEETLRALMDSPRPLNPFSLPTQNLTPTEQHVFEDSFSSILKEGEVDSRHVASLLGELSNQLRGNEARVSGADEKAKPILYPFILKTNLTPIGYENADLMGAWQLSDDRLVIATKPSYKGNGIVFSTDGNILLQEGDFTHGPTQLLENDKGTLFFVGRFRHESGWVFTHIVNLQSGETIENQHLTKVALKENKPFLVERNSWWRRLTLSQIHSYLVSPDGRQAVGWRFVGKELEIVDALSGKRLFWGDTPYGKMTPYPVAFSRRGDIYFVFGKHTSTVLNVKKGAWKEVAHASNPIETSEGRVLGTRFDWSFTGFVHFWTADFDTGEVQEKSVRSPSLNAVLWHRPFVLPNSKLVLQGSSDNSFAFLDFDNGLTSFSFRNAGLLKKIFPPNSKGHILGYSEDNGGSIIQLYGPPAP